MWRPQVLLSTAAFAASLALGALQKSTMPRMVECRRSLTLARSMLADPPDRLCVERVKETSLKHE